MTSARIFYCAVKRGPSQQDYSSVRLGSTVDEVLRNETKGMRELSPLRSDLRDWADSFAGCAVIQGDSGGGQVAFHLVRRGALHGATLNCLDGP